MFAFTSAVLLIKLATASMFESPVKSTNVLALADGAKWSVINIPFVKAFAPVNIPPWSTYCPVAEPPISILLVTAYGCKKFVVTFAVSNCAAITVTAGLIV